MGGQVLSCSTHWGPGWAEKTPKGSRALFQHTGKLSTGCASSSAAGQTESSAGCQGYSSMAAMLPAGSPGGTLGYAAGVIKPGGAALAVLVGVVQAGSAGESHLLAGLKEQSIYSSCF